MQDCVNEGGPKECAWVKAQERCKVTCNMSRRRQPSHGHPCHLILQEQTGDIFPTSPTLAQMVQFVSYGLSAAMGRTPALLSTTGTGAAAAAAEGRAAAMGDALSAAAAAAGEAPAPARLLALASAVDHRGCSMRGCMMCVLGGGGQVDGMLLHTPRNTRCLLAVPLLLKARQALKLQHS